MGERSCALSAMIRVYLEALSGNVYIPVHGVTPDFLRQRRCCFAVSGFKQLAIDLYVCCVCVCLRVCNGHITLC